jgi:hypothetical protein
MQNGLCRIGICQSHLTEWSGFFVICYAVGLLQYSKNGLSTVETAMVDKVGMNVRK